MVSARRESPAVRIRVGLSSRDTGAARIPPSRRIRRPAARWVTSRIGRGPSRGCARVRKGAVGTGRAALGSLWKRLRVQGTGFLEGGGEARGHGDAAWPFARRPGVRVRDFVSVMSIELFIAVISVFRQ